MSGRPVLGPSGQGAFGVAQQPVPARSFLQERISGPMVGPVWTAARRPIWRGTLQVPSQTATNRSSSHRMLRRAGGGTESGVNQVHNQRMRGAGVWRQHTEARRQRGEEASTPEAEAGGGLREVEARSQGTQLCHRWSRSTPPRHHARPSPRAPDALMMSGSPSIERAPSDSAPKQPSGVPPHHRFSPI